MDDKLKKSVVYTAAIGVTLMSMVPMVECERDQLCEIKSAELPHTHEPVPAPMQTGQLIQVEASTVSSMTIGSIVTSARKL